MSKELISLPIRGIDDREPLMLRDGFASNLLNFEVDRHRLVRRPGFWRFDQNPDVGPSANTMVQISLGDVGLIDASEEFLMFDDSVMYKLNSAALTWTPYPLVGVPTYSQGGFERFSVVNILNGVYATSWGADIRVWDGSAYQLLSHDLGVALSSLTLLGFNNRLVAVRTRESGAQYTSRIRWCANGLPLKWSPAATDGAGFLDVVEHSQNALTGGFTIGGRAFVCKEREVLELIATGNEAVVFRVEPRLTGVGLIAPHSWAAADFFGFFLGNDNVYQFDGSSLRAVGDPVRKTIFSLLSYQPRLTSSMQLIQGMVFPAEHQYWLHIGGLDFSTDVFVYDYKEDRWFRHQFQFPIQSMAPYNSIETASLLGPIVRDTVVLAMKDQGTFFRNSSKVTDQDKDGNEYSIPVEVVTKEFTAKEFRGNNVNPSLNRLNALHSVTAKVTPSAPVEVGVAVDGGSNFSERRAVATNSGFVKEHFLQPFQTIKFRLQQSQKDGFEVRGALEYEWKDAGVGLAR